jgi:hypothetical protein
MFSKKLKTAFMICNVLILIFSHSKDELKDQKNPFENNLGE